MNFLIAKAKMKVDLILKKNKNHTIFSNETNLSLEFSSKYTTQMGIIRGTGGYTD